MTEAERTIAARQGPRRRRTRLSVKVSEVVSRLLITVGGIGTILSVGLMCVFLVAVVLPLFSEASVERVNAAGLTATDEPLHSAVDEQAKMIAVLERDGSVLVRRLDDGAVLESLRPFGDEVPTAWSFLPGGESAAFGFADGTVHVGSFGFRTDFLVEEDVPPRLRDLAAGGVAELEGGVLSRMPEGGFRRESFHLEIGAPIETGATSPVLRLDHSTSEDVATVAAWHEDGELLHVRASRRVNLLTEEITYRVAEASLPVEEVSALGVPDRLLLSGVGDTVMAVWEDGQLVRWDARQAKQAAVVETVDLVPEEGGTITSLAFMIGKTTFVVGDSLGRVRGWFRIKPEDAGTADGSVLVPAHELPAADAAVTALDCSPRGRVVAAGHADGEVRLSYLTTDELLASVRTERADPVLEVTILPKEDGLVAASSERMTRWKLDLRHPAAGLGAFFAPVWYEGYEKPEHAWQAEGATDDFEPKFGMVPLVFGTIKATVYSMLFGAPLALLAALYTSEFLQRRLRTSIKSSIEIMASLPSVVLGFLAGVLIAPFVQDWLSSVLGFFLTLPLALLLGAYVWQLLPHRKTVAWAGWQRLFAMAVAIVVGILGALVVGPAVEALFFGGDMELWLDGQLGSGLGGWVFLLLPAAALAVVLFSARSLQPWLRQRSAEWSRGRTALVDLVKFGGGALATFLLSLAGAWLLDLGGLDPRGSFFGTYDSRNALIVGFVMGFAIIPIIYTLAEDALSGVPEHLRQASLGAGATPWQTAVRVVIPTAMSGLFSAVMIGLGRAVGETMIVLMATGNTPVMEWNVFNGFRTLSANVAVELPEAVQGGTHYRTLFLAALVLFAMTFALNTVAEIVRLRYRRRSVQL